jgi:hypothetical protein
MEKLRTLIKHLLKRWSRRRTFPGCGRKSRGKSDGKKNLLGGKTFGLA